MDHKLILLLVIAGALGAYLAYRRWIKNQTMDEAAKMAQRVFPTWASFSPFRNESGSAAALYIAYLFRLGPDALERALTSILGHEEDYREHPQHFRLLANSTLELHPPSKDSEALWVKEQVVRIEDIADHSIES